VSTLPELLFYRSDLVGKPCRRIEKPVSSEIAELPDAMIRFCQRYDGLGLAAPQLGIFVQLAIAATVPGHFEVLVNPEIMNLGGRDLLNAEGCFSLPPAGKNNARVWRSEIVQVRFGTLEDPDAGMERIYKGAAARVVQHEVDHLNGIFFIYRCGPVGRQLVLRDLGKYLRQNDLKKRLTALAMSMEASHG
jgi:peptide deformylase